MNPGAAHFVWAHVAPADCQDPSRRNPCPDTRQLRAVCSGVHNGGHPGRPSTGRRSAGSVPAVQRPRAGSSGCGGRSRTASSQSCASRGSPRSRTPTRSCPSSSIGTTRGSPCPPPIPSRPGGRGPTACAPTPSSASIICAGSAGAARSSWPGGDLALPRRADGRSWAGRSVILQERLNGSLWVEHEGVCVAIEPAPADPGQLRARHLSRPTEDRPELDLGLLAPAPSAERRASRPAADHPWRRRYSGRGR